MKVELGIGQSHDAGRGGRITRVGDQLYRIEEPAGGDGTPTKTIMTNNPPVIGIDNWGSNGPKDGAERTTIIIEPARPADWHRNGWRQFVNGLKNSVIVPAWDGRRGLQPGINNQAVSVQPKKVG